MKRLLVSGLLAGSLLTGCATSMREGHPEDIPQWWRNTPAEFKRLDVVLEGDPDDDFEYFKTKCDNMGGDTELIASVDEFGNPTAWLCEGVDF